MKCIITYQKENGDILIRPVVSTYGRKLGDTTSMGWKVLDIHYEHNGNYYCYDDFMRVFDVQIREKRNKRLLKYIAKKLNKYV
jgi:hypothetical protein